MTDVVCFGAVGSRRARRCECVCVCVCVASRATARRRSFWRLGVVARAARVVDGRARANPRRRCRAPHSGRCCLCLGGGEPRAKDAVRGGGGGARTHASAVAMVCRAVWLVRRRRDDTVLSTEFWTAHSALDVWRSLPKLIHSPAMATGHRNDSPHQRRLTCFLDNHRFYNRMMQLVVVTIACLLNAVIDLIGAFHHSYGRARVCACMCVRR
jgi:hypothetical protein